MSRSTLAPPPRGRSRTLCPVTARRARLAPSPRSCMRKKSQTTTSSGARCCLDRAQTLPASGPTSLHDQQLPSPSLESIQDRSAIMTDYSNKPLACIIFCTLIHSFIHSSSFSIINNGHFEHTHSLNCHFVLFTIFCFDKSFFYKQCLESQTVYVPQYRVHQLACYCALHMYTLFT